MTATPAGCYEAAGLESDPERLLAPVREYLSAAEDIIAENLASEIPEVGAVVGSADRFRGKRLRPGLLLLSFAALRKDGRPASDACRAAAAIEMLHLATLAHDDFLDGAAVRRRGPTLSAEWGTERAVLAGDFLLSRAFSLLAPIGDASIMETLAHAGRRICEGEILQISRRFDFDIDEETCLRLARLKTGELFAASCEVGAMLAGAGHVERLAMRRFGAKAGTAFQIVDDCLDLVCDNSAAGKDTGSDLRNGELTLPIVRFLTSASPERRYAAIEAILASGPGGDPRCELLPDIEAAGGVEYALGVARAELAGAIEAASCLPAGPAAEAILAFPDYIMGLVVRNCLPRSGGGCCL
ncbi:MAG: polyprenyl synthetase family protein [Planctomycetota bacterium]|nr:polyprenyl synthetase family protein [Planctomycetota bacterium]